MSEGRGRSFSNARVDSQTEIQTQHLPKYEGASFTREQHYHSCHYPHYLQVLGVRRWRELVTDRKKWKDIVRQVKAHSGL
jgi:hypothetical protein